MRICQRKDVYTIVAKQFTELRINAMLTWQELDHRLADELYACVLHGSDTVGNTAKRSDCRSSLKALRLEFISAELRCIGDMLWITPSPQPYRSAERTISVYDREDMNSCDVVGPSPPLYCPRVSRIIHSRLSNAIRSCLHGFYKFIPHFTHFPDGFRINTALRIIIFFKCRLVNSVITWSKQLSKSIRNSSPVRDAEHHRLSIKSGELPVGITPNLTEN
ncbi:hypothetical protein J6590_068116 [Homalodisca vitripennis]|nr:hypothetical protein J6590_068116 [Homalodisca vitripennis]